MSRLPVLIATILCLLTPTFATADGPSPDRLVVFQHEGSSPEAAHSLIEAAGGTVVHGHFDIGVAVVRGDDDFARNLERDPTVRAVVTDPLVANERSAALTTTRVDTDASSSDSFRLELDSPTERVTVTDPTKATLFPNQWEMRLIDAPEAWAAGKLGDPSVTVAVVDTGIDYTHENLVGKVDLSRSVSFVPEEDALVEQLFPGAHPIADLHFHGTHAASLIACNAEGIACVAPNVTLIGVKVFNQNDEGSVGRIVSGILHAADAGADVISMGFFRFLDLSQPDDRERFVAIKRALQYAKRQGALPVAMASFGPEFVDPFVNADEDSPQVIVPAQAGALTVSSVTREDTFSDTLSNFGHTLVDIAASGGQIPSGPNDLPLPIIFSACSSFTQRPVITICRSSKDFYVAFLGPIVSAHITSGVAALVDSDAGGELDGDALRKQLQLTADDLGDTGFDELFGHGRVNAFRATTETNP